MCMAILYLVSYTLSYTYLTKLSSSYKIIFKYEKMGHFGEIKQGPDVLYGCEVSILQKY